METATLMNYRGPVAQLDRASDYESEGRAFESLRDHHSKPLKPNGFGGFWF